MLQWVADWCQVSSDKKKLLLKSFIPFSHWLNHEEKNKNVSVVMWLLNYTCEIAQVLKRDVQVWFQSHWLKVVTNFGIKEQSNKTALKVGLFCLEQPDVFCCQMPPDCKYLDVVSGVLFLFLFGQFPCLYSLILYSLSFEILNIDLCCMNGLAFFSMLLHLKKIF